VKWSEVGCVGLFCAREFGLSPGLGAEEGRAGFGWVRLKLGAVEGAGGPVLVVDSMCPGHDQTLFLGVRKDMGK
jgi:hypothetical protein